MEIRVGESYTCKLTVEREHTAAAVGSGLAEVFATPMMIAMMEKAAAACLGQFLPKEQGSVGTYVAVSHDAATPMGMEVRITATITAVDRRKVEFGGFQPSVGRLDGGRRPHAGEECLADAAQPLCTDCASE